MSTRTVSFHTLVCDGCATQFGTDICYGSVIEARAAAYAAGWRFPERQKTSRGPSLTVNDVCPNCRPGWTTQPAQNNWANRKRKPELTEVPDAS